MLTLVPAFLQLNYTRPGLPTLNPQLLEAWKNEVKERGHVNCPNDVSWGGLVGRVWGHWDLGTESPGVALGGNLPSDQPTCDPWAPGGSSDGTLLAERPQPQPSRPSLPIPQGAWGQAPALAQSPRLGHGLYSCVGHRWRSSPLTVSCPQCCEAIYSSVSGLKAHLASCSKVSSRDSRTLGMRPYPVPDSQPSPVHFAIP